MLFYVPCANPENFLFISVCVCGRELLKFSSEEICISSEENFFLLYISQVQIKKKKKTFASYKKIRQGFWRRMFRVMLYVSLLLIKKGLSFVLIFYVPLIRNLQRRLSALSKECRNGHLHWWEESRRIVITLFMFLSVRNSIGINKQLCI